MQLTITEFSEGHLSYHALQSASRSFTYTHTLICVYHEHLFAADPLYAWGQEGIWSRVQFWNANLCICAFNIYSALWCKKRIQKIFPIFQGNTIIDCSGMIFRRRHCRQSDITSRCYSSHDQTCALAYKADLQAMILASQIGMYCKIFTPVSNRFADSNT